MAIAELNKKVFIEPILATSGVTFSSENMQNKKIILYFYPKDNTPGCTNESINFSESYTDIKDRNAIVFGISRDSLTSHENFKAKFNMPFNLIADPEELLCSYFDVMKEKNMYGRKYLGIERSTFLIDENGILVKEWRKVKVKGHVSEVILSLE